MQRPRGAAEIRAQFLRFFEEHGHTVVPSSPVFPQDDPTLLFTNAGMNQFKDVFLGSGRRPYVRAVDTQKCIRVSGKHNDLEEVGLDTYHHTFFEMLGNWSFGDYFKEDAIVWAWELLTGVWGLPKERVWVTVFGGDEADGLPADLDAARIWRERTDVDPTHVLPFGRKDNFWEMGDTGPCGPCSEIHFDRGAPGSDPRDGADRARGVNAGNERFIELWNLVFMQFNRLDDGSLRELPERHVDTGMGLERIAGVLLGKSSNYDTDLFVPIFARLEELTGRRYGAGDLAVDVAFRVCADHLRAVTAAVADGALPANTGRGYVLRRLIRRAARFARQSLAVDEPLLHELVPAVSTVLGEAFPETRTRQAHVQLVVREEEQAFNRTLGRGLVRFGELAARVTQRGSREIPGAEAYDLYATYGFPRDLVELMAREHGLTVDAPGWEAAERAHQDASRSEGKFKAALSAEDLAGLDGACESTYHDESARSAELATEIALVSLRPADPADPASKPEQVTLVLRASPFYAESGGQVGDTGTITAEDGAFAVRVDETRKAGGVVTHVGGLTHGSSAALRKGARVVARVDTARRDLTRKNHTATHLLHKALRLVLGEHVAQQGSYVGPDRLRFDFSHPKGVTAEELDRIEALVNEQVARNAPAVTTVEDLAAAKARGVVAMFGEKYAERVRVLDVGGFSLELCGGTHVRAAGDIGAFVVLSEQAVAAGVRRIEAVTGPAAVAEIQRQRALLREAAQALKSAPRDVPERIAQLQKALKEAKKKEASGAAADVGAALKDVQTGLAQRGGVASAVLDLPGLDLAALRELAGQAKALSADLALVLFGREGERVPFLVVSQGAALRRGVKAGDLARELGLVLGGGGGGKPDLAQGQGTQGAALPAAKERAESALATLLGVQAGV